MAARLIVAVMDGLQIQWLLDPSLEMETAYNDFIDHYFATAAQLDGAGHPASRGEQN